MLPPTDRIRLVFRLWRSPSHVFKGQFQISPSTGEWSLTGEPVRIEPDLGDYLHRKDRPAGRTSEWTSPNLICQA